MTVNNGSKNAANKPSLVKFRVAVGACKATVYRAAAMARAKTSPSSCDNAGAQLYLAPSVNTQAARKYRKPKRSLIGSLYEKVLAACKFLVGSSLICLSFAQEKEVSSTAEVVAVIQAAQSEILLAGTDLLNKDIALALAQTTYQNDIKTFVVLNVDSLSNAAGSGPYISMYTNLRVTKLEPKELLIVDGEAVIEGPLVARSPTLFEEGQTIAYEGASERTTEFRSLWRRAYPFEIDEVFLRDLMEER